MLDNLTNHINIHYRNKIHNIKYIQYIKNTVALKRENEITGVDLN